jgi:hypothetical protein
MKASIQRAIEVFFGLIILSLLVLLVVPWHQEKMPSRSATPRVIQTQTPDAAGDPASVLPVDAVLTLFADRARPAAVRTAAAPPAKTIAEAPWLKYMGFASGADGASWWYVKDTKTGKVIRLSQGQSVAGWTIVENGDERLVIKNGDDLYSVSKR